MNVDNYATSTQAHNEISCHREHYEIRSCEKHLTRDWRCCVRRERVQFSVTWEEHEEKKNSEKLEEKIRRPCLIAEFFQTFKQFVVTFHHCEIRVSVSFDLPLPSSSRNDLRYAKLEGTFHRNI